MGNNIDKDLFSLLRASISSEREARAELTKSTIENLRLSEELSQHRGEVDSLRKEIENNYKEKAELLSFIIENGLVEEFESFLEETKGEDPLRRLFKTLLEEDLPGSNYPKS